MRVTHVRLRMSVALRFLKVRWLQCKGWHRKMWLQYGQKFSVQTMTGCWEFVSIIKTEASLRCIRQTFSSEVNGAGPTMWPSASIWRRSSYTHTHTHTHTHTAEWCLGAGIQNINVFSCLKVLLFRGLCANRFLAWNVTLLQQLSRIVWSSP
jgi:hypothetical protein